MYHCASGLLPCSLVLFNRGNRVLHGLVAQGVDRADKEVQCGDQGRAIFGQSSLSFSVVQELLLQLWRLVRKLAETLAQSALK